VNIVQTKNKYDFPVDPNKYKMSQESPAHVGALMYAIDFITPEKTIICAALSGKVVDVKQDSETGGAEKKFDEEGNYIEIEHENGEYSIYEHISKNGSKVKIGEKVATGQVIGLTGATGWIAHIGPHLHFDVHTYFGKGKNEYETKKIRWKKI
jgi:murein DD-endopeptidase MepM/ murein hydrolase activator NlpD